MSTLATPAAAERRGLVTAIRAPREWVLPLTTSWGLSAALVWANLYRGWWPHDDGALAQSAERVLLGQVPHRDFDEIYTGGLSFFHALAFAAFGTELTSIRLLFFGVVLAWVPAVYAIAARFLSPWLAGLTTLVAVAWSVPNYTAAMPSWYNLFFATFAVAALFRFVDTDRRRWLAIAGVCVGLSVIVKVVGLFLVAAVLLFVIYATRRRDRDAGAPATAKDWVRSVPILAFPALVALGVLAVVYEQLPGNEFAMFVVPALALGAFVAWNELGLPARVVRGRAVWSRELVSPAAAFLAGVAVPLVLFSIPFAVTGSLDDLLRGVLVEPAARLEFASLSPPSPLHVVLAAPLFVVASIGRRRGRLVAAGLALVLIPLFVVSTELLAFAFVWTTVRAVGTLLVPAGVIFLMRRRRSDRPLAPATERLLFALLAVVAFHALVQFPFAAPVYFLYTLPLVVVASVALARSAGVARSVLVVLLVFFGAFAVFRLTPQGVYGERSRHSAQTEWLDVERGGIRVTKEDKYMYEQIVTLVERHSTGRYIYAAPDAPEVPFLAGRENVTPALFDFLEGMPSEDGLLARLEEKDVSLIVLNRLPDQSEELSPELRRRLAERYPNQQSVGDFDVMWRP